MKKNKYRKLPPCKQWWWTAAAINVAETTDCSMVDDEGYETEYSLWKPGGYGLNMADTERLALWDNKYPRGR